MIRIGVFLEELTQSLSFSPRVMIAFYFLFNKFRSIFVCICSMDELNLLFFVKIAGANYLNQGGISIS